MLDRHPDQYTEPELEAWVRHLIDNKVSEGPRLDYKRTIDLNAEKGRIEAAKDISSFANEIGGTLIYGVDEDRQSDEVATPKKLYGMDAIPGLEERLENVYIDRILPHLSGYRVKKVELTEYPGKVVYIAWTPESWLGPHMVIASTEKRYYRRGQLREVSMEEHEVRLRYEKSQRLKSAVYEFLASQEALFDSWYHPLTLTRSEKPPYISNYIMCPQFLEPERVKLSSTDMRQWLEKNLYFEINTGRAWRPCAEGVETYTWSETGTPEKRLQQGETIIHHNGSISRWGETEVAMQQNALNTFGLSRAGELRLIWDFLQFGGRFYQQIAFYGPLWFRISLFRIGDLPLQLGFSSDDDWHSLRSRGQSPLHLDLMISGADLFRNPKAIIKEAGDQLYRLFGLFDAPPLDNPFWSRICR